MSFPSSQTTQPTPKRAEHTLLILLTCLGLGIIADWLFRAELLGLNVSLYVSALAVAFYGWSRRLKQGSTNLLLLGALVLFTWLFSWRASLFLQWLNLWVQAFLLMLITARLSFAAFKQSNFAEVALNLLTTSFALMVRPFAFMLETPWRDLKPNTAQSKASLATLRGLLFATPLLVIFTALLASSDAKFEGLVSGLFRFNVGTMLQHITIICLVSFLVLALLAQTLFGGTWQKLEPRVPKLLELGRIETGVIFGSLVLLFASFMVVQFGYLFGGDQLVLNSDVTYASYGRRGFFELVTVTLLLHVVLLLGLWLTSAGKARLLYRVLATLLIALLFGVIWSAHSRLGLYISMYGLTELRYYSSAMTFWIGAVMVYFLFRLYSSRAPKLLPSYITLGLVGVFALYLSNPDAQITRFNLSQAQASNEVDIFYLARLSDDALPVMTNFAQGRAPGQDQLNEVLETRWAHLPTTDWRSFNLGRWQGQQALRDYIDN
jgi:Domain of unknown function (DUF4173)